VNPTALMACSVMVRSPVAWSHRWMPLPADNEDDSTSHPEGSIAS
jgi:hypothetical protein